MKILLFMLSFFLFSQILAVSADRDPFEPGLPKEEEVREEDLPDPELVRPDPTPVSLPIALSVEGLLWGSDKPQAVINGRVYLLGDKLKEVDAEIIEIDNEGVSIRYKGEIFRKSINRGEWGR